MCGVCNEMVCVDVCAFVCADRGVCVCVFMCAFVCMWMIVRGLAYVLVCVCRHACVGVCVRMHVLFCGVLIVVAIVVCTCVCICVCLVVVYVSDCVVCMLMVEQEYVCNGAVCDVCW